MQIGQHSNRAKFIRRASSHRRITAALVLLAIAGFFGLIWAVAHYNIILTPGGCAFRQQYNLPCPTCGMTTAAIAFVHGHILLSFYTQPAAGLLCSILLLTAFFALLTAVFGVYFGFIERLGNQVKLRYWLLALLIIVAAGWAVMLARAVAENNAG